MRNNHHQINPDHIESTRHKPEKETHLQQQIKQRLLRPSERLNNMQPEALSI